jgi:hypothetical protein
VPDRLAQSERRSADMARRAEPVVLFCR